MIDKMIDATPGSEITAILEEANKLFSDQNFEEALKHFERLIGMDSGNTKIIAGLLRCLIQLERFEEAKEMLSSLDEKTLENEDLLKIKKLLGNLSKKEESVIDDNLINEVNLNPKNMELRLKLANNYLSTNEIEKGFHELLKLFEQNPNWNEEAAKNKLLEYFDLLGFNDPNVKEARKKLSSMMFK